VSALVRALFENKLYFKMKEGQFLPNSGERVEQIQRQQEEAARREEVLSQGSIWLKERLQNRVREDPPWKEEILKLLTDLALFGDDAANVRDARELLFRIGHSRGFGAREILVKLGIWERDENLDLLRLDIPNEFQEGALLEAEDVEGRGVPSVGHEDLRHLHTFTIDGPDTLDFDDALSLDLEGEMLLLGIHIADVAAKIAPGSLLDQEASLRASSLYLPRRQIPMFPPGLAHGSMSLKEGCHRFAISLLCRFDKTGNLMTHRFVLSQVQVQKRLTYDEVNDTYLGKKTMGHLYALTKTLRKMRMEAGAYRLSLPEVVIQVDEKGLVALEKIDQNTPSRSMVAELMILYNRMAAQFCRDQGIPVLYRGQEKPSERLDVDERGHLYYVFKQRRQLKPLMVDTEPRPHAVLGVDVYTHMTSPIRRYLDLVMQRQIRNYLLSQPVTYSKEGLDQIRMSVEPALRNLGLVRRNRMRFWLQKYLSQNRDRIFTAVVLYRIRHRYRIVLSEIFLIGEVRVENGVNLREGDEILVRIQRSDPWHDELKLEYVGPKNGGRGSRKGE
jgi:exoribonuclease-2